MFLDIIQSTDWPVTVKQKLWNWRPKSHQRVMMLGRSYSGGPNATHHKAAALTPHSQPLMTNNYYNLLKRIRCTSRHWCFYTDTSAIEDNFSRALTAEHKASLYKQCSLCKGADITLTAMSFILLLKPCFFLSECHLKSPFYFWGSGGK